MTTDVPVVRLTLAKVQALLDDTRGQSDALDRVIDHHFMEDAEYGWPACGGCDNGADERSQAAGWPCTTVEAILGVDIRIIPDDSKHVTPTTPAEILHNHREVQEFWQAMREEAFRSMREDVRRMIQKGKPELLGPHPEQHQARPLDVIVTGHVPAGTAIMMSGNTGHWTRNWSLGALRLLGWDDSEVTAVAARALREDGTQTIHPIPPPFGH